jgi:hypothetical protein
LSATPVHSMSKLLILPSMSSSMQFERCAGVAPRRHPADDPSPPTVPPPSPTLPPLLEPPQAAIIAIATPPGTQSFMNGLPQVNESLCSISCVRIVGKLSHSLIMSWMNSCGAGARIPDWGAWPDVTSSAETRTAHRLPVASMTRCRVARR